MISSFASQMEHLVHFYYKFTDNYVSELTHKKIRILFLLLICCVKLLWIASVNRSKIADSQLSW